MEAGKNDYLVVIDTKKKTIGKVTNQGATRIAENDRKL